MLPINIKNILNGEIIHINPKINPQEWKRAIHQEFSAVEIANMRAYPDNFHYMLDALRRSVNCKVGNHFLLFDRKTQTLDQSIVYEILDCNEDRLVCKPVEGAEPVETIFEGDDLHYHMMFFVSYNNQAKE